MQRRPFCQPPIANSTKEERCPSRIPNHAILARGRLPVYHFDFYRLDNKEAVLRIGFDDYVFGEGVSLIEWADRYSDLIPPEAKWLSFELKGENSRVIREGKPQ